tara:strand:- start:833 stop:997 length:165 start_codon:yes stop_codon:yes gene_type:complete
MTTLDIKYFPISPASDRIDDYMLAGKYAVFIRETGDLVKSFDHAEDALNFLENK